MFLNYFRVYNSLRSYHNYGRNRSKLKHLPERLYYRDKRIRDLNLYLCVLTSTKHDSVTVTLLKERYGEAKKEKGNKKFTTAAAPTHPLILYLYNIFHNFLFRADHPALSYTHFCFHSRGALSHSTFSQCSFI